MRQPVNPNFERMRLEAERQRLTALEAHAADLAEQLETQAEAARADRESLQAQNAALKQALESQSEAGTSASAQVEERFRALAKQLDAHARKDEQALARLDDLRDALTSETETARVAADEIGTRIDALAGRVSEVDASFSEPERLRGAIAPILSGALRDAGRDSHDPMASAIAPYVVGTIRSEILNSEEELIEAIHPRLGVLIASSIAGAIEELNRKVDEALPIDRWIAALKGRITGGPSAGWLLDDGRTFIVKEAMLIERHSGILLASERSAAASELPAPDEDLMAGMIAALQGFASEAYGATGAGDLRRFSFTEDTVYLRGTPTKLLALRCSGIAPPEIERRVDELLMTALERMRDDGERDERIIRLDDFNTPVDGGEGGVSASTIVGRGLAGIAAAITLIWGHAAVTDAHEARWLASVDQAVRQGGNLGPYPVDVTRDGDEGPIVVSGLLPDAAAREALQQRIAWAASPVPVTLDIALVTEAGG